MNEPSFSVFADEAAEWLEHEEQGGEFVLILSLSIGSTRVVGPIRSFVDAMTAAATVSASLDTSDLALAVSIAPIFPLDWPTS